VRAGAETLRPDAHPGLSVPEHGRFSSCVAYRARYRSSAAFRLAAESEAYCAVLEAKRADGVYTAYDRQDAIQRLANPYYRLGLTTTDLDRWFVCPGLTTASSPS
jgi:hypothetical protein